MHSGMKFGIKHDYTFSMRFLPFTLSSILYQSIAYIDVIITQLSLWPLDF